MNASERELYRRLARGDEAAYRELVARVEKPLVNFVRRYLPDAASAEDVFQETFVRVVRTLGDYRPEASLSTWIFTIARNLCLDRLKSRRRHREVSMDSTPDDGGGGVIDFRQALRAATPDPTEGAEKREQRERLEAALASLAPAKREALSLRQFAGLSYEEIAAVVGAPVGTVKFRVHEAVQDLARELGGSAEGRREEAV